MSRGKPVRVLSRLVHGAIVAAVIVVHCPAASFAQSDSWTPWSAQEGKKGGTPKKGGAPKDAANKAAPAKPPETATATTVEEVVHKGHVVRARHNPAASTLAIEVNGKVIRTVGNVAQFKKPIFVPGSALSLVTIWTKNPAQDCSTHILVAIPMSAGASAEVTPQFGGCNMLTRELRQKRGNWEFWAYFAYREDSARVSVAVPRDGKLAITDQEARPCLFAKSSGGNESCSEEYIAAGLGAPERGVPSGEESAGGRRVASFLNRGRSAGSIELDGRPYKTFQSVRALSVESGVTIGSATLLSVWLHPASEACGYRMVLRMPVAGGEPETVLDRVAVCRNKTLTQTRRRPDGAVAGWARIMWRDNDPLLDAVAWSGGEVTHMALRYDACLASASITNECIDRVLPAELRGAATASAQTPKAQPPKAPTAVGSSPLGVGRTQEIIKAFKLLAEGKHDAALAGFDKVLIAEPNNAWAYTGRGYGLALMGKLDNALTDLDRAVQLNPRLAHAYCYRGYTFVLRNEPERALAQLDRALELDPRLADAHAYRGAAYFAKKDYEAALASIDRSLALAPKHVGALRVRGLIHAARKDHQKSLDDFNAAIALLPADITSQVGRGQAFEALGRTAEAIAAYEAAAALKAVTFSQIAGQTFARVRLKALAKPGDAPAACPKGTTCL